MRCVGQRRLARLFVSAHDQHDQSLALDWRRRGDAAWKK
jgi:hypothetical protein